MEELIKKIKAKKPLDRLDDTFVLEYIQDFFKKNNNYRKKFLENNLKKKDVKFLVKSVRNGLNKVYGQFWLSDKLTLLSHKSTAERSLMYDKLYDFIFAITGRPKTILDLACGLNPLTYKRIGYDVCFIVTELTDYDCNKLRQYFIQNGINGEVIKADLRKDINFPSIDVCFMFKLFDSIEAKGHLLAERLIKNINAKYIVASFSTQNIRGRKMNYPKRVWFEIMLKRLNYLYVKREENNEVFYIIKKF